VFVKILSLLLFSLTLYAKDTIPEVIYVDSDTIYLSDINNSIQQDLHLYTIDASRYSLRIEAKELLNDLKKHGFNTYNTQSRFINFIKKSPIDTTKIQKAIKEYYLKYYKTLEIKQIEVYPRTYIDKLPQKYTVNLQRKNYLDNDGIVSIETLDNKKIFFDYTIFASIETFTTRKKVQRREELNGFNTQKARQSFGKYRAKPIESLTSPTLQAKRTLRTNELLNERNVEGLDLIKRGTRLNVTMQNGAMSIIFSAKALQNGKLNDIISVQNNNKKVFRARVIGINRVEIIQK